MGVKFDQRHLTSETPQRNGLTYGRAVSEAILLEKTNITREIKSHSLSSPLCLLTHTSPSSSLHRGKWISRMVTLGCPGC